MISISRQISNALLRACCPHSRYTSQLFIGKPAPCPNDHAAYDLIQCHCTSLRISNPTLHREHVLLMILPHETRPINRDPDSLLLSISFLHKEAFFSTSPRSRSTPSNSFNSWAVISLKYILLLPVGGLLCREHTPGRIFSAQVLRR